MKKGMAALLGSAFAVLAVNAAQATMLLPQLGPQAAAAAKFGSPSNANPLVKLVRSRGRGRVRRGRSRGRSRGRHRGAFWPGAAFGAVVGGMLAAQPHYYGGYSSAVRWCMRRYRSYDPASRTYLGYDGQRHSCP